MGDTGQIMWIEGPASVPLVITSYPSRRTLQGECQIPLMPAGNKGGVSCKAAAEWPVTLDAVTAQEWPTRVNRCLFSPGRTGDADRTEQRLVPPTPAGNTREVSAAKRRLKSRVLVSYFGGDAASECAPIATERHTHRCQTRSSAGPSKPAYRTFRRGRNCRTRSPRRSMRATRPSATAVRPAEAEP